MWKVPAKAAAGSTAASRSRGSRDSSMLTLSWAPSGAASVGDRVGASRREQPVEHGGCAGGDEHALRRGAGSAVPGHLARRGRRDSDLGAGEDVGAGRRGRAGQRVGDRTHAADRHVPVAGAAADEVVEEADVLAQVARRACRRRCR